MCLPPLKDSIVVSSAKAAAFSASTAEVTGRVFRNYHPDHLGQVPSSWPFSAKYQLYGPTIGHKVEFLRKGLPWDQAVLPSSTSCPRTAAPPPLYFTM
jgi:hypothetical protein